MELAMEACMAACLDAAMVGLIVHLARKKTGIPAFEKVVCIVMAFGFALGMALGEAQHACVVLAFCGLGVILSYIAEGFAFAENAPGASLHE